jgi:hypothetical protein
MKPCAAQAITPWPHGQCRTPPVIVRRQIVNHNNGCMVNIANDHFTAYDARTAALIYKSLTHRPKQGLLQHFTKKLRPLYAAWVGRDDRNLLICQQIAKSVGEQAARIEVDGPAAEGILESDDVVNIKGDDTIGAGGLKMTGNILACYGIAGLGLAILSRVGEIGYQSRDTRRAVVTQGAKKKQQLAQLVVHALNWPAMEALQNINILAANADKWPCLMFTILEVALLMWTQVHTKVPGHLLAKWT